MVSWGRPGLDPAADLEKVAAKLDRDVCAVTLVTSQGRDPRLYVTSRRDERTVDLYCDGGYFRWPSGRRIAPVTGAAAAAKAVTDALLLARTVTVK